MSTISESPTPIKANPDWNNQVKIGSGRWDTGAFHRAIAVAADLFRKGKWNGRGLLVVNDPYQTHLKQEFYREELALGVDYEFAGDSVYQGAGEEITNYELRITNEEKNPRPGSVEAAVGQDEEER